MPKEEEEEDVCVCVCVCKRERERCYLAAGCTTMKLLLLLEFLNCYHRRRHRCCRLLTDGQDEIMNIQMTEAAATAAKNAVDRNCPKNKYDDIPQRSTYYQGPSSLLSVRCGDLTLFVFHYELYFTSVGFEGGVDGRSSTHWSLSVSAFDRVVVVSVAVAVVLVEGFYPVGVLALLEPSRSSGSTSTLLQHEKSTDR